jgi:hypothetical protein
LYSRAHELVSHLCKRRPNLCTWQRERGLFARAVVRLPIYAPHNSRQASRTHAASVLFTSERSAGKSEKGKLHVFEPVVSLSAAARICIKCAQANFGAHKIFDANACLGIGNRYIDKWRFATKLDWTLELTASI